jgi:glutamate/tyrosine decarboxylase-like PLP-dependent enzyme
LIFGGDVHVWEKFCRYFDVEPRIVPLQEDKLVIGPEDVEPHIDENTIGVAAVLGTTFTGHADDVAGINKLLLQKKQEEELDIPLHVDGASGAFVWPFLYPDSEWDFRLEQVSSINASGHKFGLVYSGIGWLNLPRQGLPPRGADLLRGLPRQAGRDLHAQLLDRLGDGARPVLQLHPLRKEGLRVSHGSDAQER